MRPRFKIVSDFDGVWTEQHGEARVLHEHLVDTCAALRGRERSRVEADLAAFRREVMARPEDYGWAPDGRISAYADEDPLCEIAGLCALLGQATHGEALRYRSAIEDRWPTVHAFAEEAFMTAMGRFRREHPPAIAPDARDQLHAVTEAGAEVVVVSNSEPAKLVHWFSAVGIDAGEGPQHELRIRGSAGKQLLGSDRSIDVRGRRIHVDRPQYRATIEQERPSLVIGDIFSLDLALPHAMRHERHPAAPRSLALRRHHHTPSWILDWLTRPTPGQDSGALEIIDHVVDRFADLAEVVTAASVAAQER